MAAHSKPPDGRPLTADDRNIVVCFAHAGTRTGDMNCPRCLQKMPIEHRTAGAIACDEICATCDQPKHWGEPCPMLSNQYGHLLGKPWLDEHWPEHVYQRSKEEISVLRKHRKDRERSIGNAQGNGSFQQGGSQRGAFNTRGNRGNRGGYQGYQAPQDEQSQDRGRGAKRRRVEHEGHRDVSRQERSRVPLADLPQVDPAKEPHLYFLQQKLKRKAAARAATNVGDIVIDHNPNVSKVAALTVSSQAMEKQISIYQAQQQDDLNEIKHQDSRLRDLKRQNNNLKLQNDTLGDQFHRVYAANEQLKTEVAAAANELVKVREEASTKVSELLAAKQEVMANWAEQELTIRRLKTDGTRVVSMNEVLENQVRDLQAEVSRLRAGTNDQQLLQAHILGRQLEAENQRLHAEVQSLQASKKQAQARAVELETALRAVSLDNASLQASADPAASPQEPVVEPAALAVAEQEEPLFKKEEEEVD